MIYLASPYSHPDPAVVEQRFDMACRAAGYLMQQGMVVFSPIAHSHPIAVRCDLPTDYEFWKHYDRDMLAQCEYLWVLTIDGWRESAGVRDEIEIAKELGKPWTYVTPDAVGLAITTETQRARSNA